MKKKPVINVDDVMISRAETKVVIFASKAVQEELKKVIKQ